MKGKQSGRRVPLHEDAKEALTKVIFGCGLIDKPSEKLFPFTRQQAHRILKSAYEKAHLVGKVTTHSLRKSFASKVYNALGRDLINTQKALGHANINSTVKYLAFEEEAIDKAIKGK